MLAATSGVFLPHNYPSVCQKGAVRGDHAGFQLPNVYLSPGTCDIVLTHYKAVRISIICKT
jgi:hypothetical protein